MRAGRAQLRESLPVEDLLEAPVGGARVGDGGLALQVAAVDRLEALVDLGVHARDEERRDRAHVEVQALGTRRSRPLMYASATVA